MIRPVLCATAFCCVMLGVWSVFPQRASAEPSDTCCNLGTDCQLAAGELCCKPDSLNLMPCSENLVGYCRPACKPREE